MTPEDVPDEDWARRSQEHLGPVRVGRVVIAPPWADYAPEQDDTAPIATLRVLPSMGFGTGHHASTRLCVSLLQELDLRGRRVLDVGTGSGVLALVARTLGAAAVVAVDDDPDAIESARANIDLNHATAIDLQRGDFRTLRLGAADVVTANLTGALLLRGARPLIDAVNPGGSLIVSGVTADEQAEVATAFRPDLRLATALAEEEWVGLRFERRWADLTGEQRGEEPRTGMSHDADYWIATLQLRAHPEGGHFTETYRSADVIPASGLPARFGGGRPCATAIYFLLKDREVSAFHRLRADEVWHHYAGCSLTLHIIDAGGALHERRLGPEAARGEAFQVTVPAGCWFGASVDDPQSYSLAGCTVAPGFAYEDFELGARHSLIEHYPQHRQLIERLTR